MMKKSIFLPVLLSLLFLIAMQTKKKFPHGNLKIECSQCHTTEGWHVNQSEVKFSHESTGFPLTGGHKAAACLDCHQDLDFSHIGIACADCHLDVHQGQLGKQCENCHSPLDWENRADVFRLHNRSSFPLYGVHSLVDCESCHFNQQRSEYAMTPIDCQGCHLQQYLSSTNPDHQAVGFGQNCEECHLPTSSSWQSTQYAHSPQFPLTGGHANVNCQDCHEDGYRAIPTTCFNCHENDYRNAKDPDHLAFGFREDCEICHEPVKWQTANFDHLANSGFELVGAHQNAPCIGCHKNNQVSNLPRDCFGCHEANYNDTSDPAHSKNNFSHICTDCHGQNSWSPATFDHDQTNFPLTGKHLTLECVDCHKTDYSGLPTTCFSCHEKDYNNTTEPNHQSAQFPVECQACHNTEKWKPASWDHDGLYFPIYSGKHKGKWDECSDCHVDLSNYKKFECINCHEHEKSKMDDEHKDVSNYQYVSTACYQCHPKGGD